MHPEATPDPDAALQAPAHLPPPASNPASNPGSNAASNPAPTPTRTRRPTPRTTRKPARGSSPGQPGVVLVTGFEPFGGDRMNPSWEVARRLDGWEVRAESRAEDETSVGLPSDVPVLGVVRSELLPCVFHEALAALHEAMARHRPVAVIGLGLAASRPDISVERIAINIDDARIPDNAGNRPIDEPVCVGAPAGYWSTLPIKSIVAALREAGIPASVSQSAGTFVCNHVFFGLAHYLAQNPAQDQAQKRRPRRSSATGGAVPGAGSPVSPRGGFIHVPWPAGEDGAIGAATSAIDLPAMTNAIRIAIRVTLSTHGPDLRLPGGAID